MEIGFIYPEMDTDTYLDSIDHFNVDISKENLSTLFPRLIVTLFQNVFLFIMWFFLIQRLFFGVSRFITAKHAGVIYLTLFAFILFIFFSFKYVLRLKAKLRPKLLRALKSEEAKESFSTSAYVERKDGSKLIRNEVAFYKMCDTLKKSKICDAAAICDGTRCRIEVQFENHAGLSVFTFYLPYHDGDVEHIVVDLNRKCVIFPREDMKNE